MCIMAKFHSHLTILYGLVTFLLGFVLVLRYLYKTSETFQYYWKFTLGYSVACAINVILIPVMMLRPGDVDNTLMLASLCRYLSPLLGLEWEFRGREMFPKEQACVIVINHQSSLDVLGFFEMYPSIGKCTVVAKKEIFYVWPIGLVCWLCGIVFIDKKNLEQAKSTLNAIMQRLEKRKIKLLVFPEGCRLNTGEIHPFRKGAFHLAVNSQLPIVPVVFSSQYFLNKEKRKFGDGKVVITALPPISTKGLTKSDIDMLVEKTRSSMSEALREINRELRETLERS